MFILVDTENVQISIQDINEIGKGTKIVFFVTKNSKLINPYIIGTLDNKGIQYSFETVDFTKAIKNCLDMHLVIYLTHKLITEREQQDQGYCIYSKDTDFSEAVLYIEKLTGVKVNVISSLAQIPTKEKIIAQRQKEIDKIILECTQSCTNMQQVYRYMVKNMRASYSMSEIADIYTSLKEKIASSLNTGISNLPIVPPISVETSVPINTDKKKSILIQPKSEELAIQLDLRSWNYMKSMLGQINRACDSEEIPISYKGKNVTFLDESVEFNKCTFALNSTEPIKVGSELHLRCIRPKQSGIMKISVNKSNKGLINKFLNSVRQKA